ncbi:unnamed protein product [Adineta ricciae]|uniref:Uncharacterized protein n=1 Tax=Adineta ricciae TaxID=249248 RepID=A0A815E784_ADIRI|nr:unnamed protein product [Adineta ricciae]
MLKFGVAVLIYVVVVVGVLDNLWNFSHSRNTSVVMVGYAGNGVKIAGDHHLLKSLVYSKVNGGISLSKGGKKTNI